MKLVRRRLLAGIGSWCGTLLLSMAAPRAFWPEPPVAGLRDRLAGLFGASTDAREIGAAYLARRPDEADADRLVTLLTEPLAAHRVSAPPELRQAFARQQREDFTHGRTVTVQGWVLSQTEARLCALAALA